MTVGNDPVLGQRILRYAREVIAAHLEGRELRAEFANGLEHVEHNGMFVTMRSGLTLRGCIGTFVGSKPFIETLTEISRDVLRDPRFLTNPVSANELVDILLEVSVLSPLKRIEDPLDFVRGNDGILIEGENSRGCFLPDVGMDFGWDKERFLTELCMQKAGTDPMAWRDPATRVFKFSVWKIVE